MRIIAAERYRANLMKESHSDHTRAAFTKGRVDRNKRRRKSGLLSTKARMRILIIQPSLEKGLSLWTRVSLSRYLKLLTGVP